MIETLPRGVVLIGTAHISATSVAEVEDTIRALRPKQVLVELDAGRLKAIRDPEAWQNTDIIQVLRQKKQHLFLLQLYLSAMQSSMGRETGVAPGTELLRAVTVAEEVGAEVVLIDRDVAITLKRGFGAMGGWAKMRLAWNVMMQVFTPGQAEPVDVEKMLQQDAITEMTEQFARFAPVVKVALIDERDAFMASHIHERAAQGPLVAVVGAGHIAGIRRHLEAPAAIPARDSLNVPPRKRVSVLKLVGYAVPLLIAGLLAYFIMNGQTEQLQRGILAYVLFTCAGGALGAILAFGHPWSILVATASAPLKVFRGPIGAGWLAGACEAKVRTPKVADFQAIKQIETLGEFWRNGVVRVLLVTALVNLGVFIGTWMALVYIAKLV
ncbi:MAG TPA: TraB/GumN family protein [Candidatus Thermoplasmatota archaeon]|nr:TraB/GumN family protein [Candidatus Thermoplasmatota archaeon]